MYYESVALFHLYYLERFIGLPKIESAAKRKTLISNSARD